MTTLIINLINCDENSTWISAEGSAENAPRRDALEAKTVRVFRVQEEAASSAVVARSQADAHERETIRVHHLQEEIPAAQ